MKTIKALHDDWALKVIPKDAPQIQRQEMEKAFYSGAFAYFTLLTHQIAEIPDDQAEKVIRDLHNELQDYFRLLRTLRRSN